MKIRARVLIIDDDTTFCRLLAEILQGAGADTDWTSDGCRGEELALRGLHDLYIVDVRMPSIDGVEIARELKARDPEVRIILISAFADASLVEKSRRLRIRLLSKPFSPHQLLKEVTDLLGRPQGS